MKGETYGLFSVILAIPLAQVPRSLKFLYLSITRYLVPSKLDVPRTYNID